MNQENEKGASVPVLFAAIDTYVERNMISSKERRLPGDAGRIVWGDGDKYPNYLLELYDSVATLRSIIDGCVDFICGDDVLFDGAPDKVVNKKGETAAEVVRALAYNAEKVGGFALNVIRAKDGTITEVYSVPMQYLRSNKDNTVFWYSEKWGAGSRKGEECRAFMPNLNWNALTPEEKEKHASSILYVKISQDHTYPAPCYAAAVKSCETERCCDDFHLNQLDNGFVSSALVNFNNGIPTDKDKEEIERTFNEKYSGHSNAGRIVFSFNRTKETSTTITPIKTEDFGEKYTALEKSSRQKIFTSFRANPNLFGIPTESLGFSSEEYESAFKLFNRTHVRPMQRKITDAFVKIYGEAVLTIIPFTLDGTGEAAVR